MTVHKALLISCDQQVNGDTCHESIQIAAKAAAGPARKLARKMGWRVVNNMDLCPSHAGHLT